MLLMKTDIVDEESLIGKEHSKYTKYLMIATKKGHVKARYYLGYVYFDQRNTELAVKHWMISAAAGHDDSLEIIGGLYRGKGASKDQYETALRAHQKAKKEMSSDERKMAKKLEKGRKDGVHVIYHLSESELAGLCGVRKAERALFRRCFYQEIGMRGRRFQMK